jgi:hypothetical protein
VRNLVRLLNAAQVANQDGNVENDGYRCGEKVHPSWPHFAVFCPGGTRFYVAVGVRNSFVDVVRRKELVKGEGNRNECGDREQQGDNARDEAHSTDLGFEPLILVSLGTLYSGGGSDGWHLRHPLHILSERLPYQPDFVCESDQSSGRALWEVIGLRGMRSAACPAKRVRVRGDVAAAAGLTRVVASCKKEPEPCFPSTASSEIHVRIDNLEQPKPGAI